MTAHSKFATLTMSCMEYTHPWTTSCADAHAGLLLHAIQECLRIYITVYTLALLMKGRFPRLTDVKRLILGVLQSSAFLSMSAFSYSLFVCTLRQAIGHFNFLTVSFIPSFLSSVCSILIERPSRRGLLCLYVANVATETVWRMAVARNLVTPVKYGEVLIFGISTAILMCFFRGGQHKENDRNDSIFDLLRFVVGPCEEKAYTEKRRSNAFYRQQTQNVHNTDPTIASTSYARFHSRRNQRNNLYLLIAQCLKIYKRLIHQIKCGIRHQSCPHPFSCIYYTLSAGVKQFSVGFGLQLCLKLLLNAKRIFQRPKHIKAVLFNKNILSLGLFLGGYSTLFRLTSCICRWTTNGDTAFHALPAGLIASIAFTQYRDNTVALYVMWKMFQRTYLLAAKKGFVAELPGFTVFLYALSTATLFHAAIIEPTNLRPSYWKFLHSLSGARIAGMAREPLDIFGLNTSESLKEVLKRTHTGVTVKHFQF